MAVYTIANVEELLQVKAHVIRYWEQEIPLIQSSKDINGRRLYSSRDMEIFLRLKHLLYERRFTIEGAKEELYKELTGQTQDLRSSISMLRSELLELHAFLKERRP
ncbi:MAG: MerR family transcriptional regulator [Treponema sp.]|jgi:DNA-binding transcriptional MerR regulator|nr:MerR family transcriptional regulator [Treponema sp.]